MKDHDVEAEPKEEETIDKIVSNDAVEKILKEVNLKYEFNDTELDRLTLKCSYITKDVLVIDKIRSNTDKRKWLYAYFSKGKGYRYTGYYESIEELEAVALYTKPVEA